jgi:excinuclease ABC subunit C
VPLYIDKNSESLKVIQRLRDEAHRFGITHHRNRRSKGQTVSALDSIKGIGEKTRTELLRHFHSLKRIREASEDEIASVVGAAKARILTAALSTESTVPAEEN